MKTLLITIALLVAACGAPAQSVVPSPTPDPLHAYTGLIHSYYAKYEAAKGNAYDYCVVGLDLGKCQERGSLMIAVWQELLKDLDATPAPAKFSADDTAIRTHLPKAIADLQAMTAAARAGDHDTMTNKANAYIDDMVPIVIGALHDIDSIWPLE